MSFFHRLFKLRIFVRDLDVSLLLDENLSFISFRNFVRRCRKNLRIFILYDLLFRTIVLVFFCINLLSGDHSFAADAHSFTSASTAMDQTIRCLCCFGIFSTESSILHFLPPRRLCGSHLRNYDFYRDWSIVSIFGESSSPLLTSFLSQQTLRTALVDPLVFSNDDYDAR